MKPSKILRWIRALLEDPRAQVRKANFLNRGYVNAIAFMYRAGGDIDRAIELAENENRCPKCETPLKVATGIGPYCPNQECPVIDNSAFWETEVQERRITDTKPDPSISMVLCKCGKHNPLAEEAERADAKRT